MNEVECAKLDGRINTQHQRLDSMNERLGEAIEDIHDLKANMVSIDNFNKLFHDVAKIREKQVDKLSIDLILQAVQKVESSTKEALVCIKKRTSLIACALVFLFLLIVWLSFVVAGENALPMLSNAFKFFLKVIL